MGALALGTPISRLASNRFIPLGTPISRLALSRPRLDFFARPTLFASFIVIAIDIVIDFDG